MYLVIFKGHEMKAKTEKEIKTWLRTNDAKTKFNWPGLREGSIESNGFLISKIDGRKLNEVDLLHNYGLMGGVLVRLYD